MIRIHFIYIALIKHPESLSSNVPFSVWQETENIQRDAKITTFREIINRTKYCIWPYWTVANEQS